MSYKFDFAFLADKLAGFRGRRLAHHPAHGDVDRAWLRGRHGVRAAAGLWRAGAAPAGRRLCRGDPQHAAADPDLHRLFRPVEPRSQAFGRGLGGDRAHRQHGRLHDRDHAGRHPVDPAHPARGRRLPGPHPAADHPACRAAAGDGARLSGTLQPVRAADAGVVHHLADLGRGADRHRQPGAVRHLPQLRGLRRSWPWSISLCRRSTASPSGRSAWCCSSASAGWEHRCDPAQRQPPLLPARLPRSGPSRCR